MPPGTDENELVYFLLTYSQTAMATLPPHPHHLIASDSDQAPAPPEDLEGPSDHHPSVLS